MSRIDYSRWNHVEVSDDEDDTHPNIDTPSLFRWRHQARLERESEWKEKKRKFEKEYKANVVKLETAKQNLEDARNRNAGEDEINNFVKHVEKLEADHEELEKRKAEMGKEERMRPWNIDTICHEGKSKTIINKADLKTEEPPDEDASFEKLQEFVKKNETAIRKYGMFKRPDDTMEYLLSNPHLVCEETANHLVLWCIDLAIEEKTDLLNHVSHQTIVMQFLLELAKSLKRDPRSCVRPFFAKFKLAEPEYMAAFNDELDSFRGRIKKRAEERVKEAMEKYEEEEKQKRLGPGGLDPVEVFESLPDDLKECFEKKDKDLLTEHLSKMTPADAEYHLDRCIKSGLWVPGASGTEPESDLVDTCGKSEEVPEVADISKEE